MKLKLLYVPRRYGVEKHEYRARHTFTPPLSTPILTAALREAGFQANQDDLDAKVFFRNWDAARSPEHPMSVFDDAVRIRRFVETGGDSEMEEEASRILALTDVKGADVIGLSVSGQHNISALGSALVMAKLLKESHGSTVILGGVQGGDSQFHPRDLLDVEFIDFIVSGYGEAALLNLASALEQDTLGRFTLDGVLWKDKGQETGALRKEPPFHQDKLGFYLPAFDGLPIDLYRYHPLREFKFSEAAHLMSKTSILMLPYYFMKGCPFRCAFCGESYSPGFEVKPIQQIVEDIQHLKKKYGSRHFLFLSQMVNPSRTFATELAEAFLEADLDIRWSDCAHIGQLDRGTVESLSEAGATRLIFGLESGSEGLLQIMDKRFSLAHARAVLELSHHSGIWNEVELVCGLPGEREEDIVATERFILENASLINYCNPNMFQLKKSVMLKTPSTFGIENVEQWEGDSYHPYRFDETGGLRWEQKRESIQKSYERLELFIGQRFIGPKGMRFYMSNHSMPFLFYLYELFGDKSKVEAVIHDRWVERKGDEMAAIPRLRGYMYGAGYSLRKVVGR